MNADTLSRGVCPESLDFQPDAVAVGQGRLPAAARLAVYAILAAVAAACAWAWFSSLDRVVVTRGKLVTLEAAVVVKPLETAVVRSIAVRPGDMVAKGALLATLDPTFASADLGQSLDRKAFLASWAGRLKAELDDVPGAEAAGTPEARDDPQVELFVRRKEEYRAKVEAKSLEIAALEEMLKANAQEQERLAGQFALAAEVEGMYRQLWNKANTSRLEYVNALREKLRVEDLHARERERRAELEARLAQARAERQAFISSWRTSTATQLMEARQQLTELEHGLAKAARRNEMVELTAPADAVVKEVAPVAEGTVVRQAEPLFTLVPVDPERGALEIETAVPAKDIGHVRLGQAARVKLAAYPFQRHGVLEGEVRMVSPDAFVREAQGQGGEDPAAQVYYKARIRLVSTRLRDAGPDFKLLPGMTADAEILAGTRRVADYLLDPLRKGLGEALREP